MPMLNTIKRRMIEHLSTLVNELHIGSDGTVASIDDGGARTLATVIPNVLWLAMDAMTKTKTNKGAIAFRAFTNKLPNSPAD